MRRSILILLLLPAGDACAYSPARPKRHDVYSENRAFVMDVDPGAKRLTVYAAGNRNQPLWSFEQGVWVEKHFLSNDGKVVAIVSWEFVTTDELDEGVCVEFWDHTGKFREYTFADLCPHPAMYFFEPGPVGFFWRKWRSKVSCANENLRVRTTDEFEYTFALDDGRIVQTTRIGLPWWCYWLVVVLGIGVAAGGFVVWRRRRSKINDPEQTFKGSSGLT